MTVKLESKAFADNQPIPRQYTGEGSDVSPPLTWSNLPEGTVELALIVDDPDAPRAEPFVHWVMYKIPLGMTGAEEGFASSRTATSPVGPIMGKNDFGKLGYGGPMPPPGKVHHYIFTLYALDTKLKSEPDWTKKQLLEAAKKHILGTGKLVGTYERK